MSITELQGILLLIAIAPICGGFVMLHLIEVSESMKGKPL